MIKYLSTKNLFFNLTKYFYFCDLLRYNEVQVFQKII